MTLLTLCKCIPKLSMACVCVRTLKSLPGVTFSSSVFKTQSDTNKGQADKVQGSTLGWVPPFWKGGEGGNGPHFPEEITASMHKDKVATARKHIVSVCRRLLSL